MRLPPLSLDTVVALSVRPAEHFEGFQYRCVHYVIVGWQNLVPPAGCCARWQAVEEPGAAARIGVSGAGRGAAAASA